MLIRNYGLFWNRENVEWGGQGRGNNGRLCGRVSRRGGLINFRNQQGVYVLYDETFKIIYVGQAGSGNNRLFSRLRQHKVDHLSQRWSRFSWFGILPVIGDGVAENHKTLNIEVGSILDHIEAILLAAAEPPLNLQRGRFGNDVTQYLQHSPEVLAEGEEDE